ncbi:thioesterase II family protein [Vibrio proteolyticus]
MYNSITIKEGLDSGIRLYTIHHAGGSHILYRPWVSLLPDWIELVALELPGRGMTFGEPFCPTMGKVIELLLNEIQTDKPFAFFGHSMGGLVAYELTLLLQQQNKYPLWLGVSAFHPPHYKNRECLSRSGLNDEELLGYLSKLGGGNKINGLSESLEVKLLILDVVRNDFRLIDNWLMSVSEIKKTTKFHCFSAIDDCVANPVIMDGWQQYIDCPLDHTVFNGDHFYLEVQKKPLLDKIVTELYDLRKKI